MISALEAFLPRQLMKDACERMRLARPPPDQYVPSLPPAYSQQ